MNIHDLFTLKFSVTLCFGNIFALICSGMMAQATTLSESSSFGARPHLSPPLLQTRTNLIAQIPPPSTLPRDIQPPSTQPPSEITPIPPLEELLPPLQPVPTPTDPLPDEPQSIVVERFNVIGSTVFTEAELAAVTQPFTNRPITLAELFQARSAVTQLYIERGYITSGAFIPPQKLEGGVVEVRVVEGQLEAIRVTGTRRLKPGYISSRIGLKTGKPLNRERLLEALRLLQLDPLLQSVSAELSAGARPGESLLEIQVTEAPTLATPITLDNGRSPTVGTFRRQAQIIHNNFLGYGDRISLGYTNTQGSNTLDVGYTIPVSPRNSTVSFSFGTSKSNVTEAPFNVLDINSRSRYFEATFRQPIVQTPSREMALGLTFTRRFSNATLFDGDLPFPAVGADADGTTRLSALRFFQEAVWRSSTEVIALRSQFSLGLGAFNATINDAPPDSRFLAWRGQAQWVRLLAPETLLLVRGDLQLANRTLLPFEQFGLGGIDTIRGYRQDTLLTDDGALLSAEVRLPILRLPKINGLLQFTPFIDLGYGWNLSGRVNPEQQFLAGIGAGLRFQLGDSITARLDYGIPLTSISGSKNSLQEQGIYFSIVINPFSF